MDKDNALIGKTTKPEPKGMPDIGIHTGDDGLVSALLDSVDVSSSVDLGAIEKFSSVAQTRESIYSVIDSMAQDDRVSAILETYAEDATDTNESGQVVWCESANSDVNKYVSYLLNTLEVDKHAYDWMYSLIKYGDLYLKMYRKSDYGDDLLFGKNAQDDDRTLNESAEKKDSVNESVVVNVNARNDHYVHYVEMVPNPCEMFELTKFGKSVGYIKAPTSVQSTTNDGLLSYGNYMTYQMNAKDVEVYDANDFVHGMLKNDSTSRNPEEVTIFVDRGEDDKADRASSSYAVRKGQSILFNKFRVWRCLSLMENTLLLNRITKSALVRLISVEVGDMEDDQIKPFMQRLKDKIEQKSAIDVGDGWSKYTNPGPVENSVFIPTHEGMGVITAQTIGGDYDPKSLTDVDWFQDKFYGDFRVPKQFFNQTDDSTGFNGGTSLTIISSRYGKAIKHIQKAFCNMVTDLVNLFLIDKHMERYIGSFRIRMQEPVTQEEIDRRENMRNRMGVINDVMNQVNSLVDSRAAQLKILKSLLSATVTDPEIIDVIQGEIDRLEEGGDEEAKATERDEPSVPKPPSRRRDAESGPMEFSASEVEMGEPSEPIGTESEDSYLPSPFEMGADMLGGI